MTKRNGASIEVSLTMLAHPIVVILFAAAVGVTAGMLVPRLWIPAAAGFGYFCLAVLAENYGPYRRFIVTLGFPAWTPYTSLDGVLVWLKCAGLLLFVAAGIAVWRTFGLPRGLRRSPWRVAMVMGGGGAVVLAVAAGMQDPGSNGIVGSEPDLSCVGATTQYCTSEPPAAAQRSASKIDQTFASLVEWGIVAPTRYVDDRAISEPDPDVGLWAVDPAYLEDDGSPGIDAVALTLSRPAACEAYFSDIPSADGERILTASAYVDEWVRARVTFGSDESAAEAAWDARDAGIGWGEISVAIPSLYRALAACDASQLPAVLP